jgi:hypothetical protein
MTAPVNRADEPKPVLITGFAPDLDDPAILARQVKALEEMIREKPGTIVLLTQASYGSLIRRREEAQQQGELSISSPLRQLTNLLAPFSVYFGHDTDLRGGGEAGEAEGEAGHLAKYRHAFAELRSPEEAEWAFSRLGNEEKAYDRRRRRLYDVLYEEGEPTRQLQRIALRLIDLPDRDACTREQIVSQMGLAAGPYYEAIWASCDVDERIVLAQLAWDGVANPKAYATILDLVHKGLVRRDPALRPMNLSFAQFIRRALPRWQLAELEEEEGTSAWSVLKWLLPLPLLLVGGFLFVTQQDAVSNVIGLAIAAGSLIPTFINFYQQFQQASAKRSGGANDS